MKVTDKVRLIRTHNSFYNRVEWWPKNGMTGIVEAIHKNGSVRIACDQLYNTSKDNKISKTFKKDEMFYEVIS